MTVSRAIEARADRKGGQDESKEEWVCGREEEMQLTHLREDAVHVVDP